MVRDSLFVCSLENRMIRFDSNHNMLCVLRVCVCVWVLLCAIPSFHILSLSCAQFFFMAIALA